MAASFYTSSQREHWLWTQKQLRDVIASDVAASKGVLRESQLRRVKIYLVDLIFQLCSILRVRGRIAATAAV